MSNPPPNHQPTLALRVVTMPRDTNQYGTIFGGVILSYIDQAGFIEARRYGGHKWVTVALDQVVFEQPVHLGDIVSCHTHATRLGNTSITVHVAVSAERFESNITVPVTSASITLVNVDPDGKPTPFQSVPANPASE